MRSNLNTVLLAILLIASSLVLGNAKAHENLFARWHQILNLPFVSHEFEQWKFSAEHNKDKVFFSYTLLPSTEEPKRLAAVTITLANAGKLLSVEDYNSVLAASDEQIRKRDFPDLGLRAHRIAPTFGPSGASSGVVFTTKDEKFDLQVVVFDSGTKSGPAAPDPIEISRGLLRAYSAH